MRPFSFIQIFTGVVLFMMVILAILSDDFKSDVKTFMYLLFIVLVAFGIQIVLFYDEKAHVYVDVETGDLLHEAI